MKKQIVIEEKEFRDLYLKFVDNLMNDMEKGWGFRIISKDGGKEMTTREEISGTFLLAWNDTFDVE